MDAQRTVNKSQRCRATFKELQGKRISYNQSIAIHAAWRQSVTIPGTPPRQNELTLQRTTTTSAIIAMNPNPLRFAAKTLAVWHSNPINTYRRQEIQNSQAVDRWNVAWISSHMPIKEWDEIIYQFQTYCTKVYKFQGTACPEVIIVISGRFCEHIHVSIWSKAWVRIYLVIQADLDF